jgi:radical SAM superfamily enzyme YgiQ (UPF0313 family)
MQQRQLEQEVFIFPIKMAMYATYLKQQGNEVHWITDVSQMKGMDMWCDHMIHKESQIDVSFSQLPGADRILTRGKEDIWQGNGNFKYRPGTYIQASNLCWWRKCTFCVETSMQEERHIRPVLDVQKELWDCYDQGFKEVFDDSGTFPIGDWLRSFLNCRLPPPRLGCNMRIGADVDFKAMRKAGFRMILFGIESFNQPTLDRLNKGVRVERIIDDVSRANHAGIESHIAFMYGYPWETAEEESRTFEGIHYLLRKGYAKTAQISKFCVEGERFVDRGNSRRLYDVAKFPEFWKNKIKDIRSLADIQYTFRGIKKGLLHA